MGYTTKTGSTGSNAAGGQYDNGAGPSSANGSSIVEAAASLASAASTSATNASNSASAASTSATNASNSASAASTSATNANNSAIAAAASASAYTPSSAAPLINGTATAGVSTLYTRGDHVHPTDTTRAPVASPTFTGVVTLAQDPVSALQAATKQYVDNSELAGFRNVLINGDFRVSQRGSSFATTPDTAPTPVYCADRWYVVHDSTTGNAGSCTNPLGPNNVTGMPYGNVFRMTAGTNTKVLNVHQRIEALNSRHLINKTVTLSYWVYHDNVSNYTVTPRIGYNSGAADVFTLATIVDISGTGSSTSIPTNTWTKVYKTVTIPAAATNGLIVDLAYQSGPATAMGVGKMLSFGFVQLEIGSAATEFEHRPYGTELALCHRYYYRFSANGAANSPVFTASAYSSTQIYGVFYFPIAMRSNPIFSQSAATHLTYFATGGVYPATTIIGTVNTPNCSELAFNLTSGPTIGVSGWWRFSLGTAWIDFSAEV